MDYKKAGVDIEAGYKSVELMKEHVKSTMRPEVLGGIGGFSGAFSLSKIKEMENPILLSGKMANMLKMNGLHILISEDLSTDMYSRAKITYALKNNILDLF